MHITSLPSEQGAGCFDKHAYEFVDWLAQAGCKYWQVLGFNPTDAGGSPYSPLSVFAGNPNFIDLGQFYGEAELLKDKSTQINKTKLLFDIYRKGYDKSALAQFVKENNYWIESYATYMAKNTPDLPNIETDLINFYIFEQMIFFEQWVKLKNYANGKGIQIIGDVPIYPAMDSADVFAFPNQFQLNSKGIPDAVAGVPPDYFNSEGQMWGNPLYNFAKMKQDKYKWWRERIKVTAKMFDVLRIDHFRAFESYYKIPAGAQSAKEGKWSKGPGMEIFNAIEKVSPGVWFILEDLGDITEQVRKLRDDTGFPGMRVMQFGFDGNFDNEHLPHNYIKNCVAYLGTHDNNTMAGFVQGADETTRKNIDGYLQSYRLNPKDTTRLAIEKILGSNADVVVLSIQDLLQQGSEARMNVPGVSGGNWKYALNEGELTEGLAKYLKMLLLRNGRV